MTTKHYRSTRTQQQKLTGLAILAYFLTTIIAGVESSSLLRGGGAPSTGISSSNSISQQQQPQKLRRRLNFLERDNLFEHHDSDNDSDNNADNNNNNNKPCDCRDPSCDCSGIGIFGAGEGFPSNNESSEAKPADPLPSRNPFVEEIDTIQPDNNNNNNNNKDPTANPDDAVRPSDGTIYSNGLDQQLDLETRPDFSQSSHHEDDRGNLPPPSFEDKMPADHIDPAPPEEEESHPFQNEVISGLAESNNDINSPTTAGVPPVMEGMDTNRQQDNGNNSNSDNYTNEKVAAIEEASGSEEYTAITSNTNTDIQTNTKPLASDSDEVFEQGRPRVPKKNIILFGCLTVVCLLLYGLYWRDTVITKRLEILKKHQETQKDRIKNLYDYADSDSLHIEDICLDSPKQGPLFAMHGNNTNMMRSSMMNNFGDLYSVSDDDTEGDMTASPTNSINNTKRGDFHEDNSSSHSSSSSSSGSSSGSGPSGSSGEFAETSEPFSVASSRSSNSKVGGGKAPRRYSNEHWIKWVGEVNKNRNNKTAATEEQQHQDESSTVDDFEDDDLRPSDSLDGEGLVERQSHHERKTLYNSKSKSCHERRSITIDDLDPDSHHRRKAQSRSSKSSSSRSGGSSSSSKLSSSRHRSSHHSRSSKSSKLKKQIARSKSFDGLIPTSSTRSKKSRRKKMPKAPHVMQELAP